MCPPPPLQATQTAAYPVSGTTTYRARCAPRARALRPFWGHASEPARLRRSHARRARHSGMVPRVTPARAGTARDCGMRCRLPQLRHMRAGQADCQRSRRLGVRVTPARACHGQRHGTARDWRAQRVRPGQAEGRTCNGSHRGAMGVAASVRSSNSKPRIRRSLEHEIANSRNPATPKSRNIEIRRSCGTAVPWPEGGRDSWAKIGWRAVTRSCLTPRTASGKVGPSFTEGTRTGTQPAGLPGRRR